MICQSKFWEYIQIFENKTLNTYVHPHGQDGKTTEMFNNGWVDKENVVYTQWNIMQP